MFAANDVVAPIALAFADTAFELLNRNELGPRLTDTSRSLSSAALANRNAAVIVVPPAIRFCPTVDAGGSGPACAIGTRLASANITVANAVETVLLMSASLACFLGRI